MIPTLLGVTLVVFVVMAFSPGGLSAGNLITGQMDPEAKKFLEDYYNKRYGLDKSLPGQYLNWLNNISPIGFTADKLTGEQEFSLWKGMDLGESMYYGRPVSDLLSSRVPITLLLNVLSIPLIYFIAIFSGVYAAQRRGSLYDRISGSMMLGLWSTPTMLAGILLIGFFASDQYFHWFPVSGLNYRVAEDMPFMPHWKEVEDIWLVLFCACLSILLSIISYFVQNLDKRRIVALSICGLYAAIAVYLKGIDIERVLLPMLLILVLYGILMIKSPGFRVTLSLPLFLMLNLLLCSEFLTGPFERGFLLDRAWHLVLPVICLSYAGIAYLSKLTRSSVLENLSADFTRTARSKGLGEQDILWRHVFRNSLLPLITVAGSLIPGLLAGSIIVETLFSIDGMGKLAVEAVKGKDRELVLSITLISGVLTLISYLLADIFYALADPRVSYD